MVRPATPGSREGLIPIISGGRAIPKGNTKSDPYAFWLRYYRSNDPKKSDPEQLRETVRLLNSSGKTRDAHAALKGFLINHPSDAESWMYRALALAIEENQGPAADIKKALNFAADIAQRSHNPNDLVGAADRLFLKGYYERVGPLLDEATARVPHRSEPMVMSINLAQKTSDARRMADSVDRLLSLGWPGQDEFFRTEARNQIERLARSLKEDGRGSDADSLLAGLAASEARDVFIRLTWDGQADFDLLVEEPLGATASYQTPRTVFGGSILKNGYGSHPEETYVCPRGFDGDYTVRVSMIFTDPSKSPTRLTLETILHEGTKQENRQVFSLDPARIDKPIVLHLSGGRRKMVLPYVDPVATVMAAARAKFGDKPAASSTNPVRKPATTAKTPAPAPISSVPRSSPPATAGAPRQ